MNSFAPLFGAIVLIGLGSVFAAIDAALNTVSMARVHELVRDERPGAVRLAKVMVDRARHINLVVLLRIICEIAITVSIDIKPRQLTGALIQDHRHLPHSASEPKRHESKHWRLQIGR